MDDSIDIQLDTLVIKGDATKLFEALAKASQDFQPVPKVATGQIGKERKFKYADFVTLMRCVRPALATNGIVILQPLHSREEDAITTTILAGHGASLQASFAFNRDPNPQEFGRHHTYYRRYQLQSLLGLGGDDDADNLPDVNQEKAQFTEQKSEPVNAPPKEASAGAKSASAKTSSKESTVSSSAPTKTAEPSKPPILSASEAKAPAGPAVEDLKTINSRLQSGMEELGWTMPKLKEFYVANVDPAGFEKASNLTIEQKTALLDKLVSVAGITPF